MPTRAQPATASLGTSSMLIGTESGYCACWVSRGASSCQGAKLPGMRLQTLHLQSPEEHQVYFGKPAGMSWRTTLGKQAVWSESRRSIAGAAIQQRSCLARQFLE